MMFIYSCDDLFLYEIIEDYINAETPREKDEIFGSFCAYIWSSGNKRRICTKSISFRVRKDLLHTELGQVFHMWSNVPYQYCKSITRDENWHSMIRQKINNIYTRYFDKEVIPGKEYMDLLKTPKRLYYEWLSGIERNADTVTEMIQDAMDHAAKVKARLQMEKMTLSWNDYKKLMECFLKRCFDHCRLLEDYEDQSKLATVLDFLTEDHFYVKYICKRLDGNIKDYQKTYYGLTYSSRRGYRRCDDCGGLFELRTYNQHRCINCQNIFNRRNRTKKQKQYRVEKLKV